MLYNDDYFNSPKFDNDIEISCCHVKGEDYNAMKGGQHTGWRFDGIRLKHLPTGIVAESREERSQFRNKEKAMIILKEKLKEMTL